MRKYQITEKDFLAAHIYIHSAMSDGRIDPIDGAKQFNRANTPKLLQEFCNDYLDDKQFTNLRNALRKQQQRRKYSSYEKPKSINISQGALYALHEVIGDCERDLTLSQAIGVLFELWIDTSHPVRRKSLKRVVSEKSERS